MEDEALRWEYRVITTKNTSLGWLQRHLNAYGTVGWEVITISATVKTIVNMTGNDMVIVMKQAEVVTSRPVRRILFRALRPGGGHPSRPAVARRLQRPTRE